MQKFMPPVRPELTVNINMPKNTDHSDLDSLNVQPRYVPDIPGADSFCTQPSPTGRRYSNLSVNEPMIDGALCDNSHSLLPSQAVLCTEDSYTGEKFEELTELTAHP